MADQSVPSWDTSYPAKIQAAQVAEVNGQTPDVNLPKPDVTPSPHNQVPVDPSDNNIPPAKDDSSPPAAQDDAPPKYEDTDEIPPKFEDTKPIETEPPPKFEDTEPANNTAMANYTKDNLQVFNAQKAGEPGQFVVQDGQKVPYQPQQATSFVEALEAGLEMSTAGLGIRGKMPDLVLPENSGMAYRIANQIGTLAGDMPAMLAGGIFGGAAGGAAGTAAVPVLGTVSGAVVGSGAGAFAVPAALRKIMIDHYEKGDIKTSGEFAERLMATSWEAMKGGITGGATALTGGAAEVAGPIAKIGAELATMTTVASGLEGHLPHAQDFIDGAIVMGGLHALPLVTGKARNIFAATGERPEVIAQAADRDVQLKQELAYQDTQTPEQASPTELKHLEISPATDTEEATTARNQLVKQDLSIKPPEPSTSERSPEEQEIASKIGEEVEPEGKTYDDKWKEFYAKNVDWTDPLKVAYAAFKDKTGTELSAEDNPHIQSRLFAGHIDFLRRVLEDGVPDAHGEFNGTGLNDIYRRVPDDDQGGFDIYSMAKRAIELDLKGNMPWKDFNLENAQKVVAQGADKFEALHKERVQAMNDALDYGVRKGVIDPEIARLSKINNQEYVPFNRIMDTDELTGQSNSSQGQLVDKIHGSERDIQNPRQSFYDNVQAIVKRAEINDIRMKALDKLSYTNEEGDFVNDFLREVPASGNLGSNQVAIYKNGKMSALEGTPLVIDSLKRLEGADQGAASVVLDIAKGISKVVRIGTTSDPGFAVRHFIRSSLMSGVYSQTGQLPFIHPLMALPEFFKGESETFKNFMSDGGATAGFKDLDSNYISNDLQTSDEKSPFINQAWNVITSPVHASEAFIKMTDNLSRFTEYKRALDQGSDRDTAAFLAREVTPDFAKVGLERSALRAAVAFQGAHINSLDRMRQAFVEDTQGTILRMSALSGISAMLWAAQNIYSDDKEVKDLPDYKKDLYWNFNVSKMFGSGDINSVTGKPIGTIFSVPKPWGPGILFGSGVERTLDSFYNKNPEAFHGFGQSLLDSVIPSIVPNALSPILEQFANKNQFSGRQLVNNDQQKELPEMMYSPYTSETAKQLAKLIKPIPGLANLGPKQDPLGSPAVIENYIKDWTGVMGGWALKIGDAGLRAAGVTPTNVGVNSPQTPLAEYPILSEFMTRFPGKSQSVETFYQNLDKTQEVLTSERALKKQNNLPAAVQMAIANPEAGIGGILSSTSKAIGTARKNISQIQDNPNIDPVQKRQLIDGHLYMITQLAQSANQQVNSFNKALDDAKKQKGK